MVPQNGLGQAKFYQHSPCSYWPYCSAHTLPIDLKEASVSPFVKEIVIILYTQGYSRPTTLEKKYKLGIENLVRT